MKGKYKGLLEDIKEKQAGRRVLPPRKPLPPPLPRRLLPERRSGRRQAEAGPSQRRQEQQPGVSSR